MNANAYLYTSTAAASEGTETITVTFSSSAHGTVSCYDTAGWSATKTASATAGSGTISKAGTNQTISATVTSYTPAVNSIEISVFVGSVCAAPGSFSVTPPEETSIQKTFTTGISTGTNCRTSAPSSNYQLVGASGVNSTVKGTTTFTDAWTIAGAQAAGSPGTNSANWAEVAAYFPQNTIQSKSLTETMALTLHNALNTKALTETIGLGVFRALPTIINYEGSALILGNQFTCGPLISPFFISNGNCGIFLKTQYQLPQAVNVQTDCLGVQVTVNSVQTLNTGVLCGAQGIANVTVYVVVACNFFQLQCWLYPLFFMGMYSAFFIGVGLGLEVSEKGFIYLIFSGLTMASIIEVQMGIMTPLLPIILIVLVVAYSFNLGDRIFNRVAGRGGTAT